MEGEAGVGVRITVREHINHVPGEGVKKRHQEVHFHHTLVVVALTSITGVMVEGEVLTLMLMATCRPVSTQIPSQTGVQTPRGLAPEIFVSVRMYSH